MKEEKRETLFNRIKRAFHESYFSIILFVAICTFVIMAIWNWGESARQLGRMFSILSPFLIGIFIAYLLNALIRPLDKFLQRFLFHEKGKKISFVISMIVSYIVVLGIIVVTVIYIVPEIGASIRQMDFNKMYDSLVNYVKELQKTIPALNQSSIDESLKKWQPNYFNFGKDAAKVIFPILFNFSKSIFDVVLNTVFSIIISIYIIIDKNNIRRAIKRLTYALFNQQRAPKAWKTLVECNHIFNGFLIGKTIDSFFNGILCFIGMSILHLPYAILISVFVAITNMIPYFGAFIGAVPGVVIYLLIDPKKAIIFIILTVAIQQFDGWFLGPKILGDQTGLKPLWVIFAITVGGAYFGVLGMFLGVPVVAVLSYLFDQFVKGRLKKKKITNI